jgi:hypothetical protein
VKYLLILLLPGCLSTTDIYTTTKQINDDSFKVATDRFCGDMAFLAANRQLSDAEIILRHEFCELYRARKQ